MKVGYQILADLQQQQAFKQWGKTISGNNVKTKFPIAFTAFCMLSVSVNSSNGNAAESVFRNGFGYTNKTLSDWILRGPTSDATYFADYIAIGCQPQWGKYTNSGNDRVITYPIAFSEVYYANVISPDNCETFVYGISNTNINYRLCNGYNDDRWNGTQTSRLFAVGR